MLAVGERTLEHWDPSYVQMGTVFGGSLAGTRQESCGGSMDKPLCDGTHRKIAFKSPACEVTLVD